MGRGARYREVEEALGRFLPADGQVLEIGCGGAVYKDLFAGRYLGVDLPDSLYSEPGDVDVFCSATRLPLGDGAFAGAFCVGTLCLVDDVGAALRELRRVIRPGGVLIVFDYRARTLRRLSRMDPTPLHVWTRRQMVSGMTQAGFAARCDPLFVRRLESSRLLRGQDGPGLGLLEWGYEVWREARGGWSAVVCTR